MKLSGKKKTCMRNIRKAIASGKALGSLLVGLAATTIGGGCQRDRGPHNVMGSYPRPDPDANVRNERRDCHVRGKYLVEPPEEPKKEEPPAQPPAKPKEDTPSAPKPAK